MSENTPEQPQRPLLDAPKDRTTEDGATGYAVYDRTVGQYVPGVSKDKPSTTEANKRVPKGHTAAVVRV